MGPHHPGPGASHRRGPDRHRLDLRARGCCAHGPRTACPGRRRSRCDSTSVSVGGDGACVAQRWAVRPGRDGALGGRHRVVGPRRSCLGPPLTALWGHDSNVPVPVYGSGGFTSYEEKQTRTQLTDWLGLGLPRVKIKIGEERGTNVTRDLERTALTRQVVGDSVEVFVDANGGYTTGQACRVGANLDDLGVSWFEEPVTSDDASGLARVRDHVAADVAAGEYGWSLGYYTRLMPALDCVQVDVTRCGGYTEWFRIVALAAAHHLEVSGHCAPYATVPAAAASSWLPAPGVVSRPRPHRADLLRGHTRPRGRSARPARRPRPRPHLQAVRRNPFPGRLTISYGLSEQRDIPTCIHIPEVNPMMQSTARRDINACHRDAWCAHAWCGSALGSRSWE